MNENNVNTEKKPSPFAGMKDQKGLKAKIRFFFDILEKYPDVREAVLYFLFSIICGASQMASQYILLYTLQLIPSMTVRLDWFLIHYKSIAEFVGFMVGAVVANTLTYILNRKKTFRSTNNLALSITLYTIMMVLLTIMQIIVPGPISDACQTAYANSHNGTYPTGIVYFLITLTGTAVAGLSALVLSFLGNKFVVMRNWGEKKNKKENEEESVAVEDNSEEAVVEETLPVEETVEATVEETVEEEATEEAPAVEEEAEVADNNPEEAKSEKITEEKEEVASEVATEE